jgi:hypothetical protein
MNELSPRQKRLNELTAAVYKPTGLDHPLIKGLEERNKTQKVQVDRMKLDIARLRAKMDGVIGIARACTQHPIDTEVLDDAERLLKTDMADYDVLTFATHEEMNRLRADETRLTIELDKRCAENGRLRQTLIRVVEGLDNGSIISADAPLDFFCGVDEEVRAFRQRLSGEHVQQNILLNHLQAERDQAETEVKALKRDAEWRKSIGALTVFRDGDQWCVVRADFKNLQESPAWFDDMLWKAFDRATNDLVRDELDAKVPSTGDT